MSDTTPGVGAQQDDEGVVVRWRRVAVRGPSMSPTLRDGDVVLVRFGGRVRAGDLVLVQWPDRPGQLSVKRAARPAEHGWWVLGDNDHGSTDSRTLGPAAVLAVVRWRLWPRPRRLRTGVADGTSGPSVR